ncbi:MAG TPA: mannonate dehydratase [Rhizomicrobium sp.]|nr:mannonate dehydratase [Rhizomicrobium sp.]
MTGKTNVLSRRGMMAASGATLLAGAGGAWAASDTNGMPQEGPDTPKLTMYISADPTESEMKKIKQIGINWVDMPDMPPPPWTQDWFRKRMDLLATQGLKLGIVMVPWFKNGAMEPEFLKVVHGLPGRDEMIDKLKASIVAAGKAGLPVIEYDFFPHRANEGYKEIPGRGGSGLLSFDYDRMKDLPPIPSEGAVSYDKVWENLTHFLKEVVPVAEKAGVRLCVHPNDPPPRMSRGSGQVLNTLKDWKRLIETVDSPSNGITFDCGVTRELGEDPVAVCRYFASRDRISQVHFRNVKLIKPNEKYVEVWDDEGDDDLLAVMKELIRNNYKRLIMPEHPRTTENDKDQKNGGYTGWVYNVGYARAMMQVALMELRKS